MGQAVGRFGARSPWLALVLPCLWGLWLRLVYVPFGNHPWALRLPALFAGLLMVPAAYAAGRVHFGRSAGLLAAGAVAGSSFLIELSTNAGGYTIAGPIRLLLFALTPRLNRSADWRSWLFAALLAAVGFWTAPIGWLAGRVAPPAVPHLVERNARLVRELDSAVVYEAVRV